MEFNVPPLVSVSGGVLATWAILKHRIEFESDTDGSTCKEDKFQFVFTGGPPGQSIINMLSLFLHLNVDWNILQRIYVNYFCAIRHYTKCPKACSCYIILSSQYYLKIETLRMTR